MKNTPPHPSNDLKQNYVIYFECSLILTLLILIGVFKFDLSGSTNDLTFEAEKQDLLHFEETFITTHAEPVPPAPPKAEVPIDLPPEEKIIEADPINLEMELVIDNPIPLPLPTNIKTFRIDSERNAYRIVEEMPKLKGGIGRLQKKIRYPRQAIRDEVQGRVIVQFVVDERGRVQDPVVLKSVREDCDNEVLEAISESRFIPGKQQGIPVRVVYTMYILFRLQYS